MVNRWVCSAVAAAALLVSVGAQAARGFTPQAGTWVVSSEVNGKPGRGLAIDVQGNTLFLQVFAYDAKGVPTFYSAMGAMDGNGVTAPLVRYSGGQSFGGDARSAAFDSSPGDVRLHFDDGLHGVVQFPGEPALAIERFLVSDTAFDAQYIRPPSTVTERRMRLVALDSAGQPTIAWDAKLMSGSTANRQLVVSRTTANGGSAPAPAQTLDCWRRDGLDAYNCTARAGAAAGDAVQVQQATLRLVGPDVQGVVETSGAVNARFGVVGDVVMGGTISVAGACSVGAYIYVQDLPCYSGDAQLPSNGTWMVAQEINGKPGRGMAIDVQNGLTIAQVFNYQGNGRSTFHMGSGLYAAQESNFTLQRYENGRAIGGEPRSATLLDSPGNIDLGFYRLDDKTKRGFRTEGVVQFPNEVPKTMVRLVLESQESVADRLLGQWLISFTAPDGTASPVAAQLVNLSQDRGGAVASADGAVQCAPVQNVAASYMVGCSWRANGGAGAVLGTAQFAQQPNNRSAMAMRIRDRHGNLVGLGAWE